MSDKIAMCDALKMKNYIFINQNEPGNQLVDAAEVFKQEIVSTQLTGISEGETHGIFYMFKDGSAMGIFQHGIIVSDPAMLLRAAIPKLMVEYEKDHGKVDRIQHHG